MPESGVERNDDIGKNEEEEGQSLRSMTRRSCVESWVEELY